MKSIHLSLVSMMALALFVVGCSGGGYGQTEFKNISRCKADEDRIPLEVADSDKSSKLSWTTLPDGNYEYVGMEIYVQNLKTGFQIHGKDSKNAEGNYVGQTVCVRNASAAEPLEVSIELPAMTKVANGSQGLYDIRTLTVSITDRFAIKTNSVANENMDVPSKVTEEQNLVSQPYKTIDQDGNEVLEIRVSQQDETFKKSGVIRIKKVNP